MFARVKQLSGNNGINTRFIIAVYTWKRTASRYPAQRTLAHIEVIEGLARERLENIVYSTKSVEIISRAAFANKTLVHGGLGVARLYTVIYTEEKENRGESCCCALQVKINPSKVDKFFFTSFPTVTLQNAVNYVTWRHRMCVYVCKRMCEYAKARVRRAA